MPVVTCAADGCEQDLWANSDDGEGYCPEHAGQMVSHGKGKAREDARNQAAMESRNEIVSGKVWRKHEHD